MSRYWAKFTKYGAAVYRIDTRVYLEEVKKCKASDVVVGAVVAKNPGSAKPSQETSRSLQPIDLANDKLIPTVRSIVTKAYASASVTPPAGSYIQVLNLFYLCDKDFSKAIRVASQNDDLPSDPSESRAFPWVMYLWGRFEPRKAPFVQRFADLDSTNHFYFDKDLDKLVCSVPDQNSFAKHTQGLKHPPVVEHLAKLLRIQRAG